MAHLNHKLPWNSLAAELKYTENRKDLTPHVTDLFVKDPKRAGPVLDYFLGALAKTIGEFSATERAKYKVVKQRSQQDPLFPPALLDVAAVWTRGSIESHGFNSIDLHETLLIENWVKNAGESPRPGSDNTYNEVVGLLIAEGEAEPLLRLASHSKIYLDRLAMAGHNYQYGWTEMLEYALMSYMCFNLVFCKPELWTESRKDHLKLQSMQSVLAMMAADFAGDLIFIPARRFMGNPYADRSQERDYQAWRAFDPFADLQRLRDYLATSFRILVMFDMLEREAGRTPNWREVYGSIFARGYKSRTGMFDFGQKFIYADGFYGSGTHWVR